MSVFVNDALLEQTAKSASPHFWQIAPVQVTAQPINRDLQDELRLRRHTRSRRVIMFLGKQVGGKNHRH
jgi:hypothetical protein